MIDHFKVIINIIIWAFLKPQNDNNMTKAGAERGNIPRASRCDTALRAVRHHGDGPVRGDEGVSRMSNAARSIAAAGAALWADYKACHFGIGGYTLAILKPLICRRFGARV